MFFPSGFIEPCQPSKVAIPPSGPLWVHEIKHDGYRLMVRGMARESTASSTRRLGLGRASRHCRSRQPLQASSFL